MIQKTQTDEVVVYWQEIIATMRRRGLLTEQTRSDDEILPVADAILLPDRCIFVLDVQQLAGISHNVWMDPALWAQWRAALQGRAVFVSEGDGLAITVARKPAPHTKWLPVAIPPSLERLPELHSVGPSGHTKRPLTGDRWAILISGAANNPKTNKAQSAGPQPATKHSPNDVKFAIVNTQIVE
ncbi:MAG: hypothetical protein JXA21_01820 [Anaerolineae bacterium]|nr:hypothetical protein [Anaerolineae bacterium]